MRIARDPKRFMTENRNVKRGNAQRCYFSNKNMNKQTVCHGMCVCVIAMAQIGAACYNQKFINL